jgi:hypothetical protein
VALAAVAVEVALAALQVIMVALAAMARVAVQEEWQ